MNREEFEILSAAVVEFTSLELEVKRKTQQILSLRDCIGSPYDAAKVIFEGNVKHRGECSFILNREQIERLVLTLESEIFQLNAKMEAM